MTFFAQFTEGVIGVPSHKFYQKKKKGGGYRIIGKPNDPMLEIQGKILIFLRQVAPRCHSAAAVRGGLGSVRNARKHIKGRFGRRFIFKLDFLDCFGHTDGKRLAEMIASRAKWYVPKGEKKPTAADWYDFLSKYALNRKGGLIQGARTSSLLLDWYCEMTVDRPIRNFLTKSFGQGEVAYTRYTDDLTFSSQHHRLSRCECAKIRQIFARAGYLENHWKTEVVDLWSGGTVKVTGPRIGKDRHIGLPRKKVKEMERMLDKELREPLSSGVKPEEISGKLLYLLDVTRGKSELNALEARTIEMYREWLVKNGRDASWPTKVLARKWKKKHPPRKR